MKTTKTNPNNSLIFGDNGRTYMVTRKLAQGITEWQVFERVTDWDQDVGFRFHLLQTLPTFEAATIAATTIGKGA